MSAFVWQDRLCKIVDGNYFLSAVGDHNNFDFMPKKMTDKMAVAGSLPGEFCSGCLVENLAKIDDERLLLIGTDGSLWILTGNPAGKTGRIYRLIDFNAPAH